MPPFPGDRSPGFFIEASRCWAMTYDRLAEHPTAPNGSPIPAAGTHREAMSLVGGGSEAVSPIAGYETLAITRKIGPSQRRHIRIAVR
jgi:hypothetical protein